MSNEFESDVTVQLWGNTYKLIPDFQSIMQVESVSIESVPDMFLHSFRKGTSGMPKQPKIAWVSAVIYGCLCARGVLRHPKTDKPLALEDVGLEIFRIGLAKFNRPMMTLLMGMCTQEDADKETQDVEVDKRAVSEGK